ncbi:MAG TPA: hypothetical protein VMW46_09770 [Candidatus Desulfaltia sp.]|nr:hypothetical protein [Candidatus Desulfaltia sp.]
MKIRGALIVLLLAMVVVYFLFFAKAGKKSYIEATLDANTRLRTGITETNMATMEKAITFFTATQGQTLENLKELFATRLFSGDPSDGWGTPLKYERLSEENYRLISAGPDRTFDTDDDIILER